MKKKKMNFKGKISGAARKTESERSNFGYLTLPDGIKLFKPEAKGTVLFDIIPYEVTDTTHPDRDDEHDIATVGSYWYKRPFKVHRNVGPNNETVICPGTFKKPCPICNYQTKLKREGKSDKDTIKDLYPSDRDLYIVIPKGNDKFDEVKHIFDFSKFNFEDLLNKEAEEQDKENFPSPDDGFTIKCRFIAKKFGDKGKPFPVASRIDFEERDEQYDDDILEENPNLDEILKVLSYKEIEDKFFQLGEDDIEEEIDDIEEEEEETVKRTKKTITPIKKSLSKSITKKKPLELPENWDELNVMTQSTLIQLVEDNDELSDIDPEDFEDNLSSFKQAVADILDIAIPKVKKLSTEEKYSRTKPITKKPPVDKEEEDDVEEDETEEDDEEDEVKSVKKKRTR
jgi:hypothetical protein